jgi:hypothetical protein
MQIVINISEDDYNGLKRKDGFDDMFLNCYEKAIINGTQLPKGHGRLIDADAIPKQIELKGFLEQDNAHLVTIGRVKEALDNAPTIIKADRSDEV